MTTPIPHPYHDLTFLSPLCEARAARLVEFLATPAPGTVVDVGCGWAELLLRVVAAAPGSHGTGLDLDVEALEHGRGHARRRGLEDRVELVEGDARTRLRPPVDAVICVGASQALAPRERGEPLPYAEALRAIRALVRPGGRVVYGEGIWSRPPTPEAVAPLAGRVDEFVSLPELVDTAVAAGFAVRACHEADLDEWDAFESGFGAGYATWLAEHAVDDPAADGIRERAARGRDRYLRGYRGILGLAYLQLIAVATPG